MIKVVIPCGPVESLIGRCLDSLLAQEETDWEAVVIMDPCGDDSVAKATPYRSEKIRVIANRDRAYALKNIADGIDILRPEDDDIIILVDGDDYLPGTQAFSKVLETYDTTDCLVTHGSYMSHSNGEPSILNAPYEPEDRAHNLRKTRWRGSHLRTYKYKVWKRINQKDFLDPQGEWFRTAWDLAIMFPAMEMAGHERTKFISDIVYVHNDENPQSDHYVALQNQMQMTDYIASRNPYAEVEDWRQ